jgi:pimeloyl-ACP methyl ester carboxylesterase
VYEAKSKKNSNITCSTISQEPDRMKRIFIKLLKWVMFLGITGYLVLCTVLYFNQEKLLFHPESVALDFQFSYTNQFSEVFLTIEDDLKLHGLFFKSDSSKGVVYYLHGNAGNMSTWGKAADPYLKLGYDVFLIDYRGFGKSEGKIYSENQFFDDGQKGYDFLKENYQEDHIIVVGFSIGTGVATYLSARHSPSRLILQAPYYSLIDMMNHTFPFAPSFLLKYPFETNTYLKQVKAPVTIFHGTADRVIYHGSSIKLKEHFSSKDHLISIDGWGHNGINDHPVYIKYLNQTLR